MMHLAVLQLDSGGKIRLNDLFYLDAELRYELAARDDVALQVSEVTAAHANAAQQLGFVTRDQDTFGWALAIGELAGVSQILTATVAEEGEGFFLDMRLINVDDKKLQTRVTAYLDGSPEKRRPQLRQALARLIDPAHLGGSLNLSTIPAQATVRIDGVIWGTGPIALVTALAPGEHRILVTQKGFIPQELSVDVVKGEESTLPSVTLERLPVQRLPPQDVARRPLDRLPTPTSISLFGIGAGIGAVAFLSGAYGMFSWTNVQLNTRIANQQATRLETQGFTKASGDNLRRDTFRANQAVALWEAPLVGGKSALIVSATLSVVAAGLMAGGGFACSSE